MKSGWQSVRAFSPGWVMTLLVIVLAGLLLRLGFWQLDRAREMRGYRDEYLNRMSEVPVRPPESFADADFLRVRLEGGYERGHDFLVDNRTHEGKTGYWVVSVFRGIDGRGYLVNRGWLAAPARREMMPAVPTPEADTRIVGLVWPDTGLPPLLAEDPWDAGWPKRVQRLERERMAAGVVDTVPVEIRLEAGQAGVFAPAPADAVFTPERNQGYAVQWFGLALVVIIGYGYFGMRRREKAA